MEIQKILFETVRNKINPNIRLVDAIGDILNIGYDSTYRRLRGEKELTISELVKLCSHFNLSVDAILHHESNNALFKYSRLDLSDMDNYEAYMNEVATLYEGLIKASSKEILLTALDIPIFHFASFLELSLFKLYAWNQSVYDGSITYDKFISKLDIGNCMSIYRRVMDAYRQIPSTEIWTDYTIDPILQLIEYHFDMNCFESKDNPGLLCHQLLQLIENLERWTEKGSKEYRGKDTSFKLCLSSVDLGNNYIITKRDDNAVTSVKLFTINAIFTSNAGFCEETEKWIRNIISKSQVLSGVSARERFRFFQSQKTKINNLMGKFEK